MFVIADDFLFFVVLTTAKTYGEQIDDPDFNIAFYVELGLVYG